MPKPKVALVIGTRPEAIKMAPVVQALRTSDLVEAVLVSTGQHREILYQALAGFDLKPDIDLDIMQHGQTLAQVTCRALEGVDRVLSELQPSYVVAQGDTTTTFVAALNAFYRQIPFAHVEAGLRTETIHNPFPEEFNRRAAGLIADLHFPPTEYAAQNLLREAKDPSRIFISGNTGIDAVMATAQAVTANWFEEHSGQVVLLTTHRRENWGEPQVRIANAALRIVNQNPDVLLVVAMHPNPKVRETLLPILGNHDRIRCIEPPDYGPFVKLIQRSALILSDSGGVQEEAPAFGVPVLVLRDTTERPEGVTAGTAQLVGTEEERIVNVANDLLANPASYAKMANAVSPYGDGRASERIRYVLLRELGIESRMEEMWT